MKNTNVCRRVQYIFLYKFGLTQGHGRNEVSWCQNRHQKVVNRGFTLVQGGFTFVQGGGWHSNLTKIPLIYNGSYFNLWGINPPKPNVATGLDDPRGKKQVWCPHVRTWGLFGSKCTVLKKVFVTFLGFSAPSAVIRRPHSDRRPGNCAPLAPFVTPLHRSLSVYHLFCFELRPES